MSTAFFHFPACLPRLSLQLKRATLKRMTSSSNDVPLWDLLACPRDRRPLRRQVDTLICESGHSYPIIEGVPVLLVSEMEQTHIEGTRSLKVAESGDASSLAKFEIRPGEVDPFVKNAIGATNGGLYGHLVGNLRAYPIPGMRLPPGNGGLFLEVGCNWGRWCLAAARLGYRVVGIDPSLKAIRAANRVATQLVVEASYLVADGRTLPFRDQVFDQVFSYSVLQHLSKAHARDTLAEIRRVLRPGGKALVQMPNAFGLRCLYHQMRRGFREARDFEVRYWRPSELRAAFGTNIGPSELEVDGYFSLNVQPSDLYLLPLRYRTVVHTSEMLRKISDSVPLLKKCADSIYISSTRADG